MFENLNGRSSITEWEYTTEDDTQVELPERAVWLEANDEPGKFEWLILIYGLMFLVVGAALLVI